jgi:hypothetical protein
MVTSSDIFRTFVPFEIVEKAGSKDPLRGQIRGIATSEAVDADDEIILQDGLDWSYFKSRGLITYEHPLGALNIVGHPTRVISTKVNGLAATAIEGELYLEDPLGKQLWEKARTMKKAGGARSLGFSIEGKVLPGGRDGKKIRKAKVHSVAISPVPKNPDSWWEPLAASLSHAFRAGHSMREILAKAEAAGYPAQGGAASGSGGVDKLATQSLQGRVDPKWLKGLTNRDLAVLHILKELPTASWAQGESVFEAIRSRV